MTLLEETEKTMIADTRERVFIFSADRNRILFDKEALPGQSVIRCLENKPKGLFKGNIITHSHTNTGFRTFTPEDISFFFSNKLEEIRLVRGHAGQFLTHERNCSINHDNISLQYTQFKASRPVNEDIIWEFCRSFSCLDLNTFQL